MNNFLLTVLHFLRVQTIFNVLFLTSGFRTISSNMSSSKHQLQYLVSKSLKWSSETICIVLITFSNFSIWIFDVQSKVLFLVISQLAYSLRVFSISCCICCTTNHFHNKKKKKEQEHKQKITEPLTQ